tara:strand:+ start:927 stop:2441 length:1515 start_codon:yes stop_codon:yes gene_type:complete
MATKKKFQAQIKQLTKLRDTALGSRSKAKYQQRLDKAKRGLKNLLSVAPSVGKKKDATINKADSTKQQRLNKALSKIKARGEQFTKPADARAITSKRVEDAKKKAAAAKAAMEARKKKKREAKVLAEKEREAQKFKAQLNLRKLTAEKKAKFKKDTQGMLKGDSKKGRKARASVYKKVSKDDKVAMEARARKARVQKARTQIEATGKQFTDPADAREQRKQSAARKKNIDLQREGEAKDAIAEQKRRNVAAARRKTNIARKKNIDLQREGEAKDAIAEQKQRNKALRKRLVNDRRLAKKAGREPTPLADAGHGPPTPITMAEQLGSPNPITEQNRRKFKGITNKAIEQKRRQAAYRKMKADETRKNKQARAKAITKEYGGSDLGTFEASQVYNQRKLEKERREKIAAKAKEDAGESGLSAAAKAHDIDYSKTGRVAPVDRNWQDVESSWPDKIPSWDAPSKDPYEEYNYKGGGSIKKGMKKKKKTTKGRKRASLRGWGAAQRGF